MSASRPCTSDSRRTSLIAAFTDSSTPAGVPFGAKTANQPDVTMPGSVDLTKGMFSNPGNASSALIAIGTSLPARTSGTSGATPSM
ncbi:hypothetical protein G6F31_021371 [Rhizopus arrhizus]|nr:hypothetical protein G6F32_017210 [Rhizopus arrhizus]KAG0915629.1 hypothetical protein G6F31_021371 [Rhizopus arrhizus]